MIRAEEEETWICASLSWSHSIYNGKMEKNQLISLQSVSFLWNFGMVIGIFEQLKPFRPLREQRQH